MYKYYSFYEQNKYHNAIRILVFYNLGFEFKGRNVTKPWYSWKNLQTNSYDSNVMRKIVKNGVVKIKDEECS